MPAASSFTSAANSSSATGTSAQSALKRFKFLSEKISQSAAGVSMNRGSTCASVQGQIEHLREWATFHTAWGRCSVFLQKRQPSYPLPAPLAEDLLSAPASQAYASGSSLSVVGWQAGRKNRLTMNLELRVFLWQHI